MFILDQDKKCLKQKNYKDLEIAVADFIQTNELCTGRSFRRRIK